MKIRDIMAPLEAFAPLELAKDFDNVGLLVGNLDDEVSGALLCVDATESVVAEAVRVGAGLIIAHHPAIFHPLRSIGDGAVRAAVKNDVAIYAAHTNLDRAPGGMSWELARQLEIVDVEPLDDSGFGVVGNLHEEMTAVDFLRKVASRLHVGAIRHSAVVGETVRRVAVVTGSGADRLESAIAAEADVLLTGDVKHDRFLAASGRILLADAGHWESEFCAIELMNDVISKKIPTFALYKSEQKNPVNYLV